MSIGPAVCQPERDQRQRVLVTKVGLRTTRPNEAWHIDTTVVRLLNGSKTCVHAIPFAMKDGTIISTMAEWECRSNEAESVALGNPTQPWLSDESGYKSDPTLAVR